jgi:nitrate reductase NapE component
MRSPARIVPSRLAGRGRRKESGKIVGGRRVRAEWLLLMLVSVGMFVLSAVGAAVFGFALWLLWRSHADLGRCCATGSLVRPSW